VSLKSNQPTIQPKGSNILPSGVSMWKKTMLIMWFSWWAFVPVCPQYHRKAVKP